MTRTVFANNRSFSHRGSGDQSVCSTPDICKTPIGNSTPPIPYPVTSQARDASGYTTTVTIDGHPTAIASSIHTRCTGDEAGSAKGIISGTTGSKTQFITNSFDVKCEGEGVVRHMDLTTMNNGNTLGVLYGASTLPGSILTAGAKENERVSRHIDVAAMNNAITRDSQHWMGQSYKDSTDRAEEEEGVFIDFYITDYEEERRIDKTIKGESIWLNVRTRNLIGELVDISLDEQNVAFIYQGQHLENNTLSGYKITKNHEKIKLEVVDQKGEIVALYFTNLSGTIIEELHEPGRLILNLKTKDMIGEFVSISLDDETFDFELDGKPLTSDTLKDIQIKSDHEKFMLKVVIGADSDKKMT